MTHQEVLEKARAGMDGFCLACPVCNGLTCRAKIPGPGAKGSGEVFHRNWRKLQELTINMNTIYSARKVDSSVELFGRRFDFPFFAAPIGAMKTHYGKLHDDISYNRELVPGCARGGIAAFTGDGVDPMVFKSALAYIKEQGGLGIPTIKPWDLAFAKEKLRLAEECGAIAVAMDVDASGLMLFKNASPSVSPKSGEQLAELAAATKLPFLVKGIMTPGAARTAVEAGAYGIVVSNHGGRVLDCTPATVEVLPGIVKAVGGRAKVFVDGGIRTGLDVFKVLALGADAALIGRPFVTAVYGGGAQGAELYARRVGTELLETMEMTGACCIKEIGPDMLWFGE